jgi:hypothetical protein
VRTRVSALRLKNNFVHLLNFSKSRSIFFVRNLRFEIRNVKNQAAASGANLCV